MPLPATRIRIQLSAVAVLSVKSGDGEAASGLALLRSLKIWFTAVAQGRALSRRYEYPLSIANSIPLVRVS